MLKNYIPFLYIFILSYALSIYKINGISNNIIISIGLIVFLNFFNPNLKFKKKYLIWSLILVFIILISHLNGEVYYSKYKLSSYTESIYLVILVLLFLTFINIINRNNIPKIINIMIFFSLLVSSFIIIQSIYYIFYSIELYPPLCNEVLCGDNFKIKPKFGYSDGLLRSNAFFDSTNRVASFLVPCAVLCLLKFKLSFNKKYFLYFIIISLAIFFNLSRSGIISYVIALTIFLILIKNYKINFKIIFTILILIIFFILSLTFLYFIFFNDSLIFSRFFIFSNENFYKLFYLINNFFDVILISLSNLGFGVGYHIVNEYTYRVLDLNYWGLHSNLLEIIGGVGFWFMCIFIIYIYILFKKIKNMQVYLSKIPKENLLLIYSLIAILSSLFFLGIVRTYFISTYSILILALFDRSIYLIYEKK